MTFLCIALDNKKTANLEGFGLIVFFDFVSFLLDRNETICRLVMVMDAPVWGLGEIIPPVGGNQQNEMLTAERYVLIIDIHHEGRRHRCRGRPCVLKIGQLFVVLTK